MLNRKVYKLLLLLEKDEQQAFGEYLDSRMFNSSKTTSRFYQLWRKKVLSGVWEDDSEMSPEEFFKGSKLKVSRVDKYCSHLYQKVMDFLALQEYLRSKETQLKKGSEALERRNAPQKEWEAQQDRLDTHLDGMGDSAEKSWQKLQLKWKNAEILSNYRENPDLWKEDFQELHVTLDSYYHLKKLKLACASINAHLIYNHENASAHLAELSFLDEIPQEGLDALTLAYWHTFKIYTDPQYEFKLLFEHLQKFSHLFSKDESKEVFGYALNYCVRRATRGEFQFKKYTAAIYRELLEKEILLIDEKLTSPVMKNIVVVHCVVGELDWVEFFLNTYKNRLAAGTDPHHFIYNEAILAIFRRDYPLAIAKLRQVISNLKNDIFYELDARTSLMMAYFEHREQLSLEEVDDMYRLLEACRFFIDRNQKISQIHKLKYGNFLRMLKRLLKLVDEVPVLPERMEKFLKEIDAMDLLISKNWLQEKVLPFLKPDQDGSPN